MYTSEYYVHRAPRPALALYLLIEQGQGDYDLEWKAPELVEAVAEVHDPVTVRAHEVHNLSNTSAHTQLHDNDIHYTSTPTSTMRLIALNSIRNGERCVNHTYMPSCTKQ